MLALRQCSTILAPILRGLILVIAVHPLTGILRRREAPVWPAATVTLIALLAVVLRLAASMALSVAQLFDEQGASEIETSACCLPNRSGSLKRSDCRRPSLAALGPARVTPSIPAPTPELVPHQRSICECTSRGTTMSVEQDRFRPRS